MLRGTIEPMRREPSAGVSHGGRLVELQATPLVRGEGVDLSLGRSRSLPAAHEADVEQASNKVGDGYRGAIRDPDRAAGQVSRHPVEREGCRVGGSVRSKLRVFARELRPRSIVRLKLVHEDDDRVVGAVAPEALVPAYEPFLGQHLCGVGTSVIAGRLGEIAGARVADVVGLDDEALRYSCDQSRLEVI